MNNLSHSSIHNIDVLIVGAGPVGLATALWFSKNKYKVVLVEQYREVKGGINRSFNERHQQIGLNPDSLTFLKDLDIVVWGEIKRKGCIDGDWINLPIYILQNILMKEIKNYTTATLLFDSKIEAVNCVAPGNPCRILVVTNEEGSALVRGLSPRLVIVADGKQDDKGVAKQFFGFSPACKVQSSSYGIVGMLIRHSQSGSICLTNYTSDTYISNSRKDLGIMYIRLLGDIKERYIALGLADSHQSSKFLSLTEDQIKALLIEAYNQHRDAVRGEPKIGDRDFAEYSKAPIPIVLDYRKETIKVLDCSSTIVSIEGDAARKTTFFSGSGLNSGFKGLHQLFSFCQENKSLLFEETTDPNNLLTIDQKLLEKDQACMQISLDLLIKGLNYINHPVPQEKKDKEPKLSRKVSDLLQPIIHSISPNEGEVPWFIYIQGNNLLSRGGKAPICQFDWGTDKVTTNNVIVYDNNKIGVKIPRGAEGKITISITRPDGKIALSPVQFTVIKVDKVAEITTIHRENEWLCVEGKNFKVPSYVTIRDGRGEERVKAYCNSVNSLVFTPSRQITGKVIFVVHTAVGSSAEYSTVL